MSGGGGGRLGASIWGLGLVGLGFLLFFFTSFTFFFFNFYLGLIAWFGVGVWD